MFRGLYIDRHDALNREKAKKDRDYPMGPYKQTFTINGCVKVPAKTLSTDLSSSPKKFPELKVT